MKKLKKYKIKVSENISRIIIVEATTRDNALYEAVRMYDEEEIILDESDYKGYECKVIEKID
jgi:hypothetical protein